MFFFPSLLHFIIIFFLLAIIASYFIQRYLNFSSNLFLVSPFQYFFFVWFYYALFLPIYCSFFSSSSSPCNNFASRLYIMSLLCYFIIFLQHLLMIFSSFTSPFWPWVLRLLQFLSYLSVLLARFSYTQWLWSPLPSLPVSHHPRVASVLVPHLPFSLVFVPSSTSGSMMILQTSLKRKTYRSSFYALRIFCLRICSDNFFSKLSQLSSLQSLKYYNDKMRRYLLDIISLMKNYLGKCMT